MSDSEMISRRKAFSLLGLAAAFGLAAAPTVLTVSDAEAQQPAPPTGQQAARPAGGTRHGPTSGAAHRTHGCGVG